jgi:hypothetical protein
VAGAFDPHHDQTAQRLRPTDELVVALAARRDPLAAQRAAQRIDGMSDMELLMRIDTDCDLWLAGFGDGGFHCGPSC